MASDWWMRILRLLGSRLRVAMARKSVREPPTAYLAFDSRSASETASIPAYTREDYEVDERDNHNAACPPLGWGLICAPESDEDNGHANEKEHGVEDSIPTPRRLGNSHAEYTFHRLIRVPHALKWTARKRRSLSRSLDSPHLHHT